MEVKVTEAALTSLARLGCLGLQTVPVSTGQKAEPGPG